MDGNFVAILTLTLLVVLPIWFLVLLVRMFDKPPETPWRAHRRKHAVEWRFWLAAAAILAFIVFVLLPAMPGAGPAARRWQCHTNLKRIGLALHNYLTIYDSFPPAYTADAQGRPLHSWRVLLLPYLEHQPLYDQLWLDEPWDSPHNRSVVEEAFDNTTLDVYRCPSEKEAPAGNTSYVLLVGPGTISDNGSCTTVSQFTDGLSNTAIVVEMADSGIHWMEPRDLDVSTMSYKINDRDAPSIRSDHPGVANVLIADGSVQTLSEQSNADNVKALTTIAGGDDIGEIFDW